MKERYINTRLYYITLYAETKQVNHADTSYVYLRLRLQIA